MKVYVRKLFPHDITHEVSVTTEIVNSFFDGRTSLYFKGRTSKVGGLVSINNATDPRFGGTFKSLLDREGRAAVDDLIVIYKGNTNYTLELIKKEDAKYSVLFELFYGKERHATFETDESSTSDANGDSPIITGDNVILYGAPGCGKSRFINDNYCKGKDERYVERIVFHPDYTYSDFVGQILPNNNDGHISYPFVPGPFTRILKKAVKDSSNNYFLIIEEINRGNAPAIFGEIFQLLDRKNGESEYDINNADIAKEVYEDPTHKIKIPKNLFILATMNTADQNVFTLDTAFKRRWSMRSIPIDIDHCYLADVKIGNTNVRWRDFLTTINARIVEAGEGIGNEDKRLGAYFVQPRELESLKLFSEKVLMYLWNDAFKYDHTKVFKAQYKTLEDLIDGFNNKDIGFNVFADEIHFRQTED